MKYQADKILSGQMFTFKFIFEVIGNKIIYECVKMTSLVQIERVVVSFIDPILLYSICIRNDQFNKFYVKRKRGSYIEYIYIHYEGPNY